tara:strand:+ start:228 stop:530 length:303 start_codon:yes stop_codon:yes gene_type:complete
MESNKQEKYNLEHDNPVVKHASWMSKFAGNSRMGHSPAKMGHEGSPAKHKATGHAELKGGFKMYDKQPHTSSAHSMQPKKLPQEVNELKKRGVGQMKYKK